MINHKPKELAPVWWVELVVFISSYYPLFLILLLRDMSNKEKEIELFFEGSGYYVSCIAVLFFTVSSVAFLVSAKLMRKLLVSQSGGRKVIISKCHQVRGDMLNYTLPFLIGLFAFDYSGFQSIASLIVFLFFMFLFARNERVVLLNPMLLLVGIRLYHAEYKEFSTAYTGSKSMLVYGELVVGNANDPIFIKETTGIQFAYPQQK